MHVERRTESILFNSLSTLRIPYHLRLVLNARGQMYLGDYHLPYLMYQQNQVARDCPIGSGAHDALPTEQVLRFSASLYCIFPSTYRIIGHILRGHGKGLMQGKWPRLLDQNCFKSLIYELIRPIRNMYLGCQNRAPSPSQIKPGIIQQHLEILPNFRIFPWLIHINSSSSHNSSLHNSSLRAPKCASQVRGSLYIRLLSLATKWLPQYLHCLTDFGVPFICPFPPHQFPP